MQAGEPPSVLEDVIRAFSPDLIGISVRNIDDQSLKETQFFLDRIAKVIGECRRLSEAPIVLGGAGYSIYPQSALDYLAADMGIQGEGEIAFVHLLRQMEHNADISEVPGLYVAGKGLQRNRAIAHNLDALPLPEAGPAYLHGYHGPEFWLPVQTRRGCPMRCNYCSTGVIEGCLIRKRSPKEVIAWMKTWVDFGYRRFYFVDNTFNLPPSYALALCDEISSTGLDISWRAIIYPARIDESLVKAVAAAGCKEVSRGHCFQKRFVNSRRVEDGPPGDVQSRA